MRPGPFTFRLTICWTGWTNCLEGKKLLFICAAGVRSGLACEYMASMGMEPESLYNIEDGTPRLD